MNYLMVISQPNSTECIVYKYLGPAGSWMTDYCSLVDCYYNQPESFELIPGAKYEDYQSNMTTALVFSAELDNYNLSDLEEVNV